MEQRESQIEIAAAAPGQFEMPITGLEYGFTVLVAVFLLRWVMQTLTQKLEKIEELLEQQVKQQESVHKCLDALKADFDQARKEATGLVVRIFGEKPKDGRRNWRE